MNVKMIVKSGLKWCSKHAPSILTGLGVGGVFASVILGCSETPKAMTAISEAKAEKAEEEGVIEKLVTDGDYSPEQVDDPLIFAHIVDMARDRVKLTPWEIFKATAPVYWPTALITFGTAGCIIFANHLHLRRTAALVTALGASDKAFKQYKEKMKELVGEKEEKKVYDEIAKEDIQRNALNEDDVVCTRFGNYLCLEPLTGRYFRSNIDNIRRAVMTCTSNLRTEGLVPFNDFLDELELPQCDVGDMLAWYAENPRDEIDIGFSYQDHPTSGEPCAVIVYHTRPEYQI